MNKMIPIRRTAQAPARQALAHPLEALHRQMNELFEGFFDDSAPLRRSLAAEDGLVTPRFEVSESDAAVTVSAELPGLAEKDIEVTLDEGLLTVSGEKKAEREEKNRNYFFSERSYGRFERSIPLPAGLETGKAKAEFKQGVLRLTLPKSAQARRARRKIPITGG